MTLPPPPPSLGICNKFFNLGILGLKILFKIMENKQYGNDERKLKDILVAILNFYLNKKWNVEVNCKGI